MERTQQPGDVSKTVVHVSFQNKFFSYEGECVAGKRHGIGKLSFADGGYYEGNFVNGEIEGQGERYWPNGNKYSGMFSHGERHGQGAMFYADGSQYDGTWVLNARQGRTCCIKFYGVVFFLLALVFIFFIHLRFLVSTNLF
eukprot:m.170526 g.170526  ORF g.170526 m.170526 type:complete len:141 (+) comp15339_c0_seq1:112-534(+)